MKNIFLFLSLSLTVFLFSNSKHSESWISLGYESSLLFEESAILDYTNEREVDSQGINLSAYTFYNGSNLGIFVNDSFLIPNKAKVNQNGNKITADFSDLDWKMQLTLVIGPVYRFPINDKSFFRIGVGPSITQHSVAHEGNSAITYNIGIGGDVGYKYDLTDAFYFDIGLKLGHDFYAHTTLKDSYGSETFESTDLDSYGVNRIAFYIGLGMNFYSLGEGIGKLDK